MLQGFGKVSIRKKDMNETQFKSEKYCKKSDVVSIPINQIHKPTIRGGQQVRQGAEDSGHIRAIAASMKESGQSVPISVEKEINGTYTLVAGSHRFGAALISNRILMRWCYLLEHPRNDFCFRLKKTKKHLK